MAGVGITVATAAPIATGSWTMAAHKPNIPFIFSCSVFVVAWCALLTHLRETRQIEREEKREARQIEREDERDAEWREIVTDAVIKIRSADRERAIHRIAASVEQAEFRRLRSVE
jgi:hypothetical protein